MAEISTERDVVAMPSLKSDGTPDQTSGYKVLDENGEAKAASTFKEFRDKTQETVAIPADSAAGAADPAAAKESAAPKKATSSAKSAPSSSSS